MDHEIKRRGLMLVLSSPSGAGKTTISRALLERDANITMSVSVTTRPKRPGEVEGVDYFFVDPTEFDLMVNRGELLEYAKVFGHYYGTPRTPVEKALSAGRDVLFDIDWQGTQQLKAIGARRPGQRLHPAAVDRGARAAPEDARAGLAPRSSPSAWPRPPTR